MGGLSRRGRRGAVLVLAMAVWCAHLSGGVAGAQPLGSQVGRLSITLAEGDARDGVPQVAIEPLDGSAAIAIDPASVPAGTSSGSVVEVNAAAVGLTRTWTGTTEVSRLVARRVTLELLFPLYVVASPQ